MIKMYVDSLLKPEGARQFPHCFQNMLACLIKLCVENGQYTRFYDEIRAFENFGSIGGKIN